MAIDKIDTSASQVFKRFSFSSFIIFKTDLTRFLKRRLALGGSQFGDYDYENVQFYNSLVGGENENIDR